MTLIKSHLCTKCGGALTVHNDRQQYECPYCSVFFNYEYFRSQDILDQAASSQKVLQFESAIEKYDFLLQKEPHNFVALRGKLLSESKINRPSELSKIARVAQISPKAISETEEKAFSEHKPYFETLLEMNALAEKYCEEQNPPTATTAERKAVHDQFVELSVKLFELDPLGLEKPGIEEDGENEKMKNVTTVNLQNSQCCTGCGGELIVNLNRQLYECPFCGLTFDFDYIRDETAANEAARALARSQFIKADAIYSYILTVDPSNFEALRGRILCAATWPTIQTVNVIRRMNKVYLTAFEARINEAIEKCKEIDTAYFEMFKKIIPWIKSYNLSVSPSKQSMLRQKRLDDGMAHVDGYMEELEEARERAREKGYGYGVDERILDAIDIKEIIGESLHEANHKVKALNAKGRVAECQIGEIFKNLVKWERNRNSKMKKSESEQ